MFFLKYLGSERKYSQRMTTVRGKYYYITVSHECIGWQGEKRNEPAAVGDDTVTEKPQGKTCARGTSVRIPTAEREKWILLKLDFSLDLEHDSYTHVHTHVRIHIIYIYIYHILYSVHTHTHTRHRMTTTATAYHIPSLQHVWRGPCLDPRRWSRTPSLSLLLVCFSSFVQHAGASSHTRTHARAYLYSYMTTDSDTKHRCCIVRLHAYSRHQCCVRIEH